MSGLGARLRNLDQRRRYLTFKARTAGDPELGERRDVFRHCFKALAFNGIEGHYAEFGCFGGRTFRLAYSASRLARYPTHLWAFDSFMGLPPPEDQRDLHPRWVPGSMATGEARFRAVCARHGIPPSDYTVVAGYYARSLAAGAPGQRPEVVSFAYVDCDLYSSTVDVLRFLEPRLRAGSILVFDDYYCYGADGPSGERAAMLEVFPESGDTALLPYHPVGWHGMSFIVERRAAGTERTATGWGRS